METVEFSLIYPNMRRELISHLQSLSNIDHQRDCWVDRNCPDGVEYDCFDFSVHFLFDDTPLSEDPESVIGVFLESSAEARLIAEVCTALDQVLDKYGTSETDAFYIATKEWHRVVDASIRALKLLDIEGASS